MPKKWKYKAREVPGGGHGNMSHQDAAILGPYIEKLAKKNNDHLTPYDLVNDARNPESPLHTHFEWNDAIAAEKWRTGQARRILRSIVIEVEDLEDAPVRAFFSIIVSDGVNQEPRYVHLDCVLQSDDYRHQVVQTALKELQGWKQRYQLYSELSTVIVAIDDLSEQFKKDEDGVIDTKKESKKAKKSKAKV